MTRWCGGPQCTLLLSKPPQRPKFWTHTRLFIRTSNFHLSISSITSGHFVWTWFIDSVSVKARWPFASWHITSTVHMCLCICVCECVAFPHPLFIFLHWTVSRSFYFDGGKLIQKNWPLGSEGYDSSQLLAKFPHLTWSFFYQVRGSISGANCPTPD